jgi:hypothetical protein
LLVHGTLKECNTQPRKSSTEQVVTFFPNIGQHPKQRSTHHHRNTPNRNKPQTLKSRFQKTLRCNLQFTYRSNLSVSCREQWNAILVLQQQLNRNDIKEKYILPKAISDGSLSSNSLDGAQSLRS